MREQINFDLPMVLLAVLFLLVAWDRSRRE